MQEEGSDLRAVAAETRALAAIISKKVARTMHERLAQSGLGITPIQIGVMRLLSMHPHTLSELSKLFSLDPSTLVPVIDGLETRGMVERRKDPNDRRRVPLVLTPEAQDAMDNIHAMADDDVLLGALTTMGAAKAEQLRDLLRDLLRALPEGTDAICTMQDRLARLDSIQTDRPATPTAQPS